MLQYGNIFFIVVILYVWWLSFVVSYQSDWQQIYFIILLLSVLSGLNACHLLLSQVHEIVVTTCTVSTLLRFPNVFWLCQTRQCLFHKIELNFMHLMDLSARNQICQSDVRNQPVCMESIFRPTGMRLAHNVWVLAQALVGFRPWNSSMIND